MAILNDIDEMRYMRPMPMVTSKKPNTKIYFTIGRGSGKTLMQYEYIKAMLEAGYEFVLVEECETHSTFLVQARREETDVST